MHAANEWEDTQSSSTHAHGGLPVSNLWYCGPYTCKTCPYCQIVEWRLCSKLLLQWLCHGFFVLSLCRKFTHPNRCSDGIFFDAWLRSEGKGKESRGCQDLALSLWRERKAYVDRMMNHLKFPYYSWTHTAAILIRASYFCVDKRVKVSSTIKKNTVSKISGTKFRRRPSCWITPAPIIMSFFNVGKIAKQAFDSQREGEKQKRNLLTWKVPPCTLR